MHFPWVYVNFSTAATAAVVDQTLTQNARHKQGTGLAFLKPGVTGSECGLENNMDPEDCSKQPRHLRRKHISTTDAGMSTPASITKRIHSMIVTFNRRRHFWLNR